MRTLRFLGWVVLVAAGMAGARGMTIPYYKMDSLVLMSDVIVLAEEQEMWSDRIEHENWAEVCTVTRGKAVKVFKGDWKEGSEFTVRYGSLFGRWRWNDDSVSRRGADRKALRPAGPMPRGRALLFLKRTEDGYAVVTAKLIQGDEVWQFGQFASNPGGLVLARQRPENITVEKYGEAELVEDLRAAMEKAKTMRAPVGSSALDALFGEER